MPSAENRHTRADVAAVSAESCVAETIPHQPTPHVGDRPFEHRRGHRVGEAVAGQRGDDDVESVFGAPAVGQRVGQERQEVEMLEERAREAMGEDDRKRGRPVPALVDEMHPQPVDPGEMVRQTVELALLPAPIELVGPGGQQRAKLAGIDA
jgi:hypothetical protein